MAAAPAAPTRPALDRLAIAVAWVVPAGILVQAVLAGQGWFVDQGLITLHGGVGHGVLTLAVLLAAWAWWRRPTWAIVVLASAGVLGLVAQTGLGYTGRRGGIALASSLHVPLGTILLASTVLLAVLLQQHLRSRS